jgi:hypothetical protein
MQRKRIHPERDRLPDEVARQMILSPVRTLNKDRKMESKTQEEKNMKRIITGSVLAVLMGVSTVVLAQSDDQTRNRVNSQQQVQQGPKDHDNDGIPNGQDADYTGPGKDANKGKGSKGQGAGQGQGVGKNSANPAFVDKDGDGVCDNQQNRKKGQSGNGVKGQGQSAGQGKGNGNGNGQGMGQGRGRGQGFVDADNDGVCDNYQQRKKGSGAKQGGTGAGKGQ